MKAFFLSVISLLFFQQCIAQDDSLMFVHYINVGQANAALLEFPCGAVLIDAGAQDVKTRQYLVNYLKGFFKERKDLQNTLDLVIVTHCHIDHDLALMDVADNFYIKNYIDNGLRYGSGDTNQVRMQDEAASRRINYGSYTFETITAGFNRGGITNDIIDPIECGTVNPRIILYSGSPAQRPKGWTKEDSVNGNNHSLFIKVLFGEASFLFIGDGETAEMNTVVNYYNGTNALDADVLMVGHHGAKNATSAAFLQAVTPSYAVISCGYWADSTTGGEFNTYHYGHPTDSAINMLSAAIPGNRPEPITVKAGLGSKDFIDVVVTKRIYCTAWDNDIIIRAKASGAYSTIIADK